MIAIQPAFRGAFNRTNGLTTPDGDVIPLSDPNSGPYAALWASIYREATNAAVRRTRVLLRGGAGPRVVYLWQGYIATLMQRHGAALEAAGLLYEAHDVPITTYFREHRGFDFEPNRGQQDARGQWIARYRTARDFQLGGQQIQRDAERALGELPQLGSSDAMGFIPAIPAAATFVLYGIGIVAAGVVAYELGRMGLQGLFAYLGVDLESMAIAREQIEAATAEAMESCRQIADPQERADCLQNASDRMVDSLAEASERLNQPKILPALAAGAVGLGALLILRR